MNQKLSKKRFQKGHIPWNKNISWNEAIRLKIKETTKKTMKTPEVEAKISKTWFKKGQKPWSFGLKGTTRGMLGKHHSEETKEKIKISTLKRNYKHSPIIREIIKKTSLKRWRNEDYRNRTLKSMLQAIQIKPNQQEKALEIILNNIYPNEYKYVGNGQFVLGGKCPDFMNINGKKKLIEMFGDYWHRNDNPQNRINYFKQYGFDTLIIWERELKNLKMVKEKLLNFNKI